VYERFKKKNDMIEDTSDSLDWTPQQALKEAMDLFEGNGKEDVPDGVLILYYYQDQSPNGKQVLYSNAGLDTYQVMCLTNYVNHRAAQRIYDQRKERNEE
jgi:hypothetical protein